MEMHDLDMKNGKARMAWAGEAPWHGLGKQVPEDLTPEQMLEAADLNWKVRKVKLTGQWGTKRIKTNKSALIREEDAKVLSVVSNDWNPVQNHEAFDFFDQFVKAGHLKMNTAGALRGGRIVWALAEIKDGFELFKGDEVKSYFLFTVPHVYGRSTDLRHTPTRVVCSNTLRMALGKQSEESLQLNHRKPFDREQAMELLGLAHRNLDAYREVAEFLGKRAAKLEDVKRYFSTVFPVSGDAKKKEESTAAGRLVELLETQPGAEFARGTWWQAFNAVTFYVDHEKGKTADTRLDSAWFGGGARKKAKALDLARQFAAA